MIENRPQAIIGRAREHSSRVPLPDWQIELLEERIAEAEAKPDDTVPWEEVRAEMRARLRPAK